MRTKLVVYRSDIDADWTAINCENPDGVAAGAK